MTNIGRSFILIIVFSETLIFGKARIYDKYELVSHSDLICIGTVTDIQDTLLKGKYWTYSSKATIIIDTVLFGNQVKQITTYGNENFICAQTIFRKGHFLFFLTHQDSIYTGTNWHLSFMEIQKDQVEWYSTKGIAFQKESTVIKEISELIASTHRKQNLRIKKNN